MKVTEWYLQHLWKGEIIFLKLNKKNQYKKLFILFIFDKIIEKSTFVHKKIICSTSH